jgi:opacity protein-like surface antigen
MRTSVMIAALGAVVLIAITGAAVATTISARTTAYQQPSSGTQGNYGGGHGMMGESGHGGQQQGTTGQYGGHGMGCSSWDPSGSTWTDDNSTGPYCWWLSLPNLG